MNLFMRSDGKVWWVRFTVDGHQHRVSTGEVEKDRAVIAARRIWQAKAGHSDAAEGSPQDLFDARLDELRDAGRSGHTLIVYSRFASKYLAFFGVRPLADLTRKDIEEWRAWLMRQRCASAYRAGGTLCSRYAQAHLAWLSGFFKRMGLPSPVAQIQRPTVSHAAAVEQLRYFTQEEMAKLFEVVKRDSPEAQRAFTLLAYTGTRKGELYGLRNRPEDIEPATQSIWVTGKYSKRRQLVLGGSAQPAWDAVAAQQTTAQPGGPLWDHHVDWIGSRMVQLCKWAQIPQRGPHALRHTFATFALMFWGWNIAELARWLGHADISTTYAVYGHLTQKTPPIIDFSARLARVSTVSGS